MGAGGSQAHNRKKHCVSQVSFQCFSALSVVWR
ncbi:hypothetical protein [Klebsiella phage KpF5]|nr:hypothetical protein [Klebsiella phage KpF5]